MAEIRWTLQALDDVEAIANYIARDSTHYAQMFAVKTFEAVWQIEKFPESGRIVPEINQKNIREILLTLLTDDKRVKKLWVISK